MAENSNQQGSKKDWSRVPPAINPENLSVTAGGQGTSRREGTLASVPAEPTDVPAVFVLPLPDPSASEGIVANWKAKQLTRKTALAKLKVVYNGDLEALRQQVTGAVIAKKTQVHVLLKQYLSELDGRYLEALSKLDIRNVEMRWNAVTNLNEKAVAKVNEVEGKKAWPDDLIANTVQNIWDLRQRVANKIMEELGIEYSKE